MIAHLTLDSYNWQIPLEDHIQFAMCDNVSLIGSANWFCYFFFSVYQPSCYMKIVCWQENR